MDFEAARKRAQSLDESDALREFRDRFVVTDPDTLYLKGNSLGRLARSSQHAVDKVVSHEWAVRLVRGWQEGWYEMPQRVGAKIANCIGARPNEVLACDSTTVNLYKLAHAALRLRPDRHVVVTDDLNFSSDYYALQSVVEQAGENFELRIVSSPDGVHGDVSRLAEALDEKVALVSLSHTSFRSGYVWPMDRVTALVREAGATMLWDLSHSVGVVPVDLNGADAEFAVGCTYKYLNGGPGAPAFLYAREDLHDQLETPVKGWFGHARPFEFEMEFAPARGLDRFLVGTPPIVSLSAVEASVDLVNEAGIGLIRAKSESLTRFLQDLYDEFLADLGVVLRSPREPERRGSHLSFSHPAGYPLARTLIEDRNVLVDYRAPDLIRMGLSPLYVSHTDLCQAVERWADVLIHETWRGKEVPDATVT